MTDPATPSSAPSSGFLPKGAPKGPSARPSTQGGGGFTPAGGAAPRPQQQGQRQGGGRHGRRRGGRGNRQGAGGGRDQGRQQQGRSRAQQQPQLPPEPEEPFVPGPPKTPGIYTDRDLVYVDPESKQVIGHVEWSRTGSPKSMPFVKQATPEKEERGGKRRSVYPWGTLKSMKGAFRLEGKQKKGDNGKTLEEILPKALAQAFWDADPPPAPAAPAEQQAGMTDTSTPTQATGPSETPTVMETPKEGTV